MCGASTGRRQSALRSSASLAAARRNRREAGRAAVPNQTAGPAWAAPAGLAAVARVESRPAGPEAAAPAAALRAAASVRAVASVAQAASLGRAVQAALPVAEQPATARRTLSAGCIPIAVRA